MFSFLQFIYSSTNSEIDANPLLKAAPDTRTLSLPFHCLKAPWIYHLEMSPPGEPTGDLEDATKPVAGAPELELVNGKVSKTGILLRPQPTNDPNEPLVGAHVLSGRFATANRGTELATMGKIQYISGRVLVHLLGIHELVCLHRCSQAHPDSVP